MAAVASFNSRYYVGKVRFSAYGKDFQVAQSAAMLDVTSLEDSAAKFAPGRREASASASMMLDTDTTSGGQFDTINTWTGTPQVLTFGAGGCALSDRVQLVLANRSQVTTSSPVDGLVMADVTIQPDGGVDYGVVVAAEAAITTDTNGTAVDNSAATSNGGVAHLHVTAFSGLTSDAITIEHSTDNAAWSTLVTFTSVTGTTSQRVAVTGTVNRYLRVVDDVTGTGSCTRLVAFARR